MNNLEFKKIVWSHYKKLGRHNLPWRKNTKVYNILVSEIMLQQTQVSRVFDKYKTWIKMYPDFTSLAAADFVEVLSYWQGFGYQRRARYLQQIAQIAVEKYGGTLPKSIPVEELISLPGIGPYTARAIKTFVSNSREVFIETNIRTIYIHHFFQGQEKVDDIDILKKIKETLDTESPREWYWALMDYGSFLKSIGIKNNTQSKSYLKQKKFLGSNRQIRGKILKILLTQNNILKSNLIKQIGVEKNSFEKALLELEKEGFVAVNRGRIAIQNKL